MSARCKQCLFIPLPVQIMREVKPQIQKSLGRTVKNFKPDEWDKVNINLPSDEYGRILFLQQGRRCATTSSSAAICSSSHRTRLCELSSSRLETSCSSRLPLCCRLLPPSPPSRHSLQHALNTSLKDCLHLPPPSPPLSPCRHVDRLCYSSYASAIRASAQ